MKSRKFISTIAMLLFFVASLSAQTTTYNSAPQSGNSTGKWDQKNNWVNKVSPGFIIDNTEIVNVDHPLDLKNNYLTVNGGVLNINTGGSLTDLPSITIENGGIVNITENTDDINFTISGSTSELNINGTSNLGTITGTEGSITVNGSISTNAIQLSGTSTFDIDINGSATLSSLAFSSNSSFTNNGDLTINGTTNIAAGATLLNLGNTFTANGDITNNGLLESNGVMDLNASMDNIGTFNIYNQATVYNSETIDNTNGYINGMLNNNLLGYICSDDGTTNPIVGGNSTNVNDVTICGASDEDTYPIELVGFEVKKEDNSVQVIWSTATEINNDYFTIERAAGNQDFKAIGTVQGAGNSNQTLNYSYTDNDAPNGEQLYYRIKQTDYDGSYSYSWIQNVNIENNVTVNVYPNPVQRGQNIMIQSSEDNLLLNLYDAQGNKVRSSNLNHNQNKIETSDLNPGLYFIRLQNSYDETTVTRKLIIQ